jgi:hypothetical protein
MYYEVRFSGDRPYISPNNSPLAGTCPDYEEPLDVTNNSFLLLADPLLCMYNQFDPSAPRRKKRGRDKKKNCM